MLGDQSSSEVNTIKLQLSRYKKEINMGTIKNRRFLHEKKSD